ncbi:MAG: hypothetical protein DRO11_03615, partial [Methanobacteriota archaeon]
MCCLGNNFFIRGVIISLPHPGGDLLSKAWLLSVATVPNLEDCKHREKDTYDEWGVRFGYTPKTERHTKF